MSHDSDIVVIHFFVKILKCVSAGLLWMMLMIFLGLRFKMAYPSEHGVIVTVVFYMVAAVSLFFTARYIFKTARTKME